MKEELFLEKIVKWCQWQYKQNKIPFVVALLTGVLTYMFAFTNKLVNHDEVGQLFAKGAGLSSGRWGIEIISYIFPDYSMPWIYGIISIVLIAISTCIIVNIFSKEIKCYRACWLRL